jgi:uncharacterized protein (DUF1778 family)
MWQIAAQMCRMTGKGERIMSVLTETYSGAQTRINFRIPEELKEIIERAALASGLTVTDFAISSLVQSAHNVLDRLAERRLSDRDRDLFLAILDEGAKPNEAIKKAARRYKRLKARK